MSKRNTFYLTTAISYINGAPHLGHAYEAIATDTLARFKRLDGLDTYFVTGTDEHGEKNARSATKAGMKPLDFADRNSKLFMEMAKLLNISYSDFIRTSEERHHVASKAIWSTLADKGEIYLGTYGGWYSVVDEAFIGEDELTEGPDNRKFAPSGAELEWVEEPSYFFRLSKWGQPLLDYYERNRAFIKPETRRNEVISFVQQGLKDLSISRERLDWGVPVPGDDQHVMYVWLDALTNYVTALGYPDIGGEAFQSYWPADVHIIGKDIVRFHAVYWPAFLMAAGIDPPTSVFCHGFLNIEGQKMSKSLGNVLSPKELVVSYGLDQLRYFLLREVPFGQDGSFSHEQIIRRINGDLANDYGNLAQRILSMIYRNCNGMVPEPSDRTAEDSALTQAGDALYEKCSEAIDRNISFHVALTEIWQVIGAANRYVDAQAPWKLIKSNPERMKTVLYVVADLLRKITILLQPYIPTSAAELLDQLSVLPDRRSFAHLGSENSLTPLTNLPRPKGLFPRYSDNDKEY